MATFRNGNQQVAYRNGIAQVAYRNGELVMGGGDDGSWLTTHTLEAEVSSSGGVEASIGYATSTPPPAFGSLSPDSVQGFHIESIVDVHVPPVRFSINIEAVLEDDFFTLISVPSLSKTFFTADATIFGNTIWQWDVAGLAGLVDGQSYPIEIAYLGSNHLVESVLVAGGAGFEVGYNFEAGYGSLTPADLWDGQIVRELTSDFLVFDWQFRISGGTIPDYYEGILITGSGINLNLRLADASVDGNTWVWSNQGVSMVNGDTYTVRFYRFP